MPSAAARLLFAATTFVAAMLVFLVQPMVARQLLPAFGGTPGVWNATVTFFQVALLCGYAIAHVSLRVLGVRRQPCLQLGLALAALAFLPFTLRTGAPPSDTEPALWIALVLAAGVGLPYLAVTTASPVMQRWYAELGQDDSVEPWFLYVASNAGSLVGLLGFPLLLEPRFGNSGQERAWLAGFLLYLLGLAACAWVVRRRTAGAGQGDFRAGSAATDDAAAPARIGIPRGTSWVLVAALPVLLMLGVTTFVTTDVASAPLLWVVPLSLYLVSFMVTFGRRWRIGPRPAGIATAISAVLVLFVELDRIEVDELGRIGAHLLAVTCASVLAHARLYEDRPPAAQLTTFYLLLSVGGAIGGSFISIVAPAIFDDVYEYPLALALAVFLRPAPRWSPSGGVSRGALLLCEFALAGLLIVVLAGAAVDDPALETRFVGDGWLLLVLLGLALLLARRAGTAVVVASLLALTTFAQGDASALHRDRNFFGTLRVEDEGGMRRMLHGTTLHGGQLLAEDRRRDAATYYTEEGPVGDLFESLQEDEPFVEVGVVGLGAGSILAHARMWQRFTYYEIDPAVIAAARDPDLFTMVPEAPVRVRVVEGDARLSLEDEERRFDLLVLDAYSSDAVPVHLMTVEALRLYSERLAPGGVMAMHISSRHLDLEPVVAANAARLGIVARTRVDRPDDEREFEDQATGSQWIALARDEDDLAPIMAREGWRTLRAADDDDAWTDEFSNVARTIRWLPGWLR